MFSTLGDIQTAVVQKSCVDHSVWRHSLYASSIQEFEGISLCNAVVKHHYISSAFSVTESIIPLVLLQISDETFLQQVGLRRPIALSVILDLLTSSIQQHWKQSLTSCDLYLFNSNQSWVPGKPPLSPRILSSPFSAVHSSAIISQEMSYVIVKVLE